MQIGQTKLTNFQVNFVKELMGELFATDVRIEAKLNAVLTKYNVDGQKFLGAISSETKAPGAK